MKKFRRNLKAYVQMKQANLKTTVSKWLYSLQHDTMLKVNLWRQIYMIIRGSEWWELKKRNKKENRSEIFRAV